MRIVLRTLAAVFLLLVIGCLVFYEQPLWVLDQQIRFNLWRQGVRSDYIDAGGYRTHYFEAKPSGSAPDNPLLLIHGLGSRGEDWAALIPGLTSAGFHVYVPDLLGYGRSAQPDTDYSISTEENLVVAFMQAKGIAKADVGGWSMGGWVAAKLALDHPEMVDRLIIYDSVGIYFPPTFASSVFTANDATELARLQAILDPHPPKLPGFVARAAIRRLQDRAWVVNRSLSQMLSGRELLDFRLESIRQPTLLVWGSRDQLVPLSVGQTMHRLIPNSSMTVIDCCGHLAPGQCWHSALKTTIKFLKADPVMKNMEQTLPGN